MARTHKIKNNKELKKLLAVVISSNGCIKSFSDQRQIKKATLIGNSRIINPYYKSPKWIKDINETKEDDVANIQSDHGGKRFTKMTNEMVSFIIGLVESNPVMTLQEMRAKLINEFGIQFSLQTINRHLDCQAYSIKNLRIEPEKVNSPENKALRREFVSGLLEIQSSNMPRIYMDETNFNIFISRSEGRSKVGQRCRAKFPTCKGKNIHLIGAIGPNGLIICEILRGSFNNQLANEYIRRLLRSAKINYGGDVCLVIDNAPCHSRVEQLLDEEEFSGCLIKRLAPYSPMLNPIEHLWSSVKSKVKSELASKMPDILNNIGRKEESIQDYRLRILSGLIVEAMLEKSTCSTIIKYTNNVMKHYADALDEKDMSF